MTEAVVAGIVLLIVLCIYIVVKNLLHICQPNEVLIFSGGRRTVGNKKLGYRLVKGGRGLRKPLIERVDRLDLTNMVIDVSIRDAYAKGGIPLNVDAVANVKISGIEPIIYNAIERFLGKPRREVMRIAKETLEGNLRGILATLTPEAVNEDKQAFQQSLVAEAEEDLSLLGLALDTLNIQNISDDRGYLDSIGRRRSADLQKMALIAEATTQAESAIQAAENHQQTRLAQITAEMDTARAEAQRRITDALTRRNAVIAEQQAEITAAIAKASAEMNVQEARIEQIRRKLEADVIEPSQANMHASISDAIGRAAKIIEDGKATAEALGAITETWKKAGDNARDIFLLQKVDVLMRQVLETVHDLKIDRVTVLPGSDGANGNSPSTASKLVSASEQLKAALGIDLPGMIQSFTEKEDN